jgi:ribosomal protein L24E
MNDFEFDAAVAKASRLLGLAESDARQCSRAVPEVDAYFFWQPVRGGGQLFVHRDGTVLFGASVLTFEDMYAAFAAGRRTDPRAWD